MRNDEEILSPRDIGRMLRVDTRVVSRWVDAGLLPAFRTPGGHRRIRRSDLDIAMRKVNGDDWPLRDSS